MTALAFYSARTLRCTSPKTNVIAMQSDKHAMEMFSKEDTNYSKVDEKMKFFMGSRGPMQV